jgi:hypothetical protein
MVCTNSSIVENRGKSIDLQGKARAAPDQCSVRSGDYDLIHILR